MKKILSGILCLAVLSCNRNSDQPFNTGTPPQQTNQLIPWLEKQKSNVASDSGKQAITNLEASLLISESVIRPSGYGKKVMITPIKKEPATREVQSTTTFLLSQLNSEGRIIRSNIVTYTPETAAAPVRMPADLFENYYGDGRLPDVKLTFRSNTGRLLFETAFRNGDVYSHSYPEIKNRANHSGEFTENECVEWYWQTYVNGVLVSEVYLGTTCGPYVEEGSGGGATGGGEPEEVEIVRYPEWVVLENPSPYGIGEIKSHETFRGKRNSSLPGGGYFTQNSHAWSYCNFCQGANDGWSETSHSNTFTSQLATTTVTGNLYYLGIFYQNLTGTKTWTFTEIFN